MQPAWQGSVHYLCSKQGHRLPVQPAPGVRKISNAKNKVMSLCQSQYIRLIKTNHVNLTFSVVSKVERNQICLRLRKPSKVDRKGHLSQPMETITMYSVLLSTDIAKAYLHILIRKAG